MSTADERHTEAGCAIMFLIVCGLFVLTLATAAFVAFRFTR